MKERSKNAPWSHLCQSKGPGRVPTPHPCAPAPAAQGSRSPGLPGFPRAQRSAE